MMSREATNLYVGTAHWKQMKGLGLCLPYSTYISLVFEDRYLRHLFSF